MSRSFRLRLSAAVALAALAAGIVPAGPVHAAADTGQAAGKWLSGQVNADGYLDYLVFPGFSQPDWGLTIDGLIALAASGADNTRAVQMTEAIAAHVDDYITFGDPNWQDGGSTAKVLYAATVAGRDPATFGGHDMRRRTLDRIAGPSTGAKHGWIQTHYAGEIVEREAGNMFDQSLAVLGLARSGGVPQEVVDFLIGQQCPSGGFRIFAPADGARCTGDTEPGHVDASAVAVQALLAADKTGSAHAKAAAEKGAVWLVSKQDTSGGFPDEPAAVGGVPNLNANSTGLAGQALAAVGKDAAAGRAAAWVASVQLTAGSGGAAAAHAGAIGLHPAALADAQANGIAEMQIDQWRRATAQAVLVQAGKALGEIKLGAPSPSPSTSASPSASASPAPGGGGSLPVTGAAATRVAGVGAAAVFAGVVLMLLARRRRSEP